MVNHNVHGIPGDTIIQEAARIAGITAMTRNYPDDHKQRSAGHWAGFKCGVDAGIAQLRQELSKALTEKAEMAADVARKAGELSDLRKKKSGEVVRNIATEEQWSAEKRDAIAKRIAS